VLLLEEGARKSRLKIVSQESNYLGLFIKFIFAVFAYIVGKEGTAPGFIRQLQTLLPTEPSERPLTLRIG